MRVQTVLFLVGLTIAAAPAGAAHPGSGIVVDRAGNVYFVRAGRNSVWRLSPAGHLTKFVEDDIVRLPHHLAIGGDGALYFASDFDGRIWRADSAGQLTEHFNTNRIVGHPDIFVGQWGDPWALDTAGNVYALSRQNGTSLVRVSPAGAVAPVAGSRRFGELHLASMVVGRDGALYLTDAARVWRIVGDSAVALGSQPLARGAGIAVAGDGSVYAADPGAGRVVRLSHDGAVTTPAALGNLRLADPWGVTLAPDGSLYILDHIANGQGVAIWRVAGDQAQALYVGRSFRMFIPPFMLTLVALLFGARTAERRPRGRADWILWAAIAGFMVGGAWWIGRTVWIFEWLRHALLVLWLWGAWRSWSRIETPDRSA